MFLYNWETKCIILAILSDLLITVTVNLVTDKNAAPLFIWVPNNTTLDDCV